MARCSEGRNYAGCFAARAFFTLSPWGRTFLFDSTPGLFYFTPTKRWWRRLRAGNPRVDLNSGSKVAWVPNRRPPPHRGKV